MCRVIASYHNIMISTPKKKNFANTRVIKGHH